MNDALQILLVIARCSTNVVRRASTITVTFTYIESEQQRKQQANYINALAVSVLPFFEPAMPMTLGGLFVTLGGFWYDIG
jgi:hypothetical protein